MCNALKGVCKATSQVLSLAAHDSDLDTAVVPGTPITGGMGECCAPKLLNHAARNGLKPLSIAEFFWGEGPMLRRRVSGKFYPSCEARCQPLLGFMLCGLDE